MIRFSFILFITILTLTPGLQAQTALNDSLNLENEILSYRDTELEIVNKSRKMIADNLLSGNVGKVREIYDYLSAKLNHSDVIALWGTERWLLLYWINYHPVLLDSVKNYKERKRDAYSKKLYPARDLLFANMLDYSKKHQTLLIDKIDALDMSDQDKDFLHLFLEYLFVDKMDSTHTQDGLNQLASSYLTAYPQAPYNNFIRKYIRFIFQPSKWGFGFNFFSGWGEFKGGLNQYFTSNVTLGVAFDVYYHNWVLFLRDYIGVASKTKRAFDYKGSWKKSLKLNVFLPELSIGYVAHNSRHFRVIPFAGLSSMDIAPPEKVKNESGNDVELKFVTTYTAGLNIDIKFPNKSSMPIISRQEQSYWFIRLRAAYNKPTYEKRDDRFSGSMIYFNIGVGGFGRAILRIL